MSIRIDIKILLFLVIFYITKQLDIYLLLMLFIIFHELTHLTVAMLLGSMPITMEINQIGCAISFKYKLEDYNKKILKGNLVELKKVIIYIAGPLFNILVGIIALFFRLNSCIVYINIFIAIFNLICIYPLDGGRIIKSILHIFLGEKRAYEIILNISNIFFIILLILCSFLILKFHNVGILIGIIYISAIKIKNSKDIRLKLKIIDIINKD